MNLVIIIMGKLLSLFLRVFNLGNGSTWPGHMALKLNKNFINDTLQNSNIKVVIIAGTNGKTTTSKLITTILIKSGKKVLINSSGANLINGIASTVLLNSSLFTKINYDYAIFEVDENSLPHVLAQVSPDYLIVLNLFRDQLDRYGEVNIIANKWRDTLTKLNLNTTLLLNCDDSQVFFLGQQIKLKTVYFSCRKQSLLEKNKQSAHIMDSNFCPKCDAQLSYKNISFSHLGDWHCNKCGLKRPSTIHTTSPFYPLVGVYNEYNTNSAVLFALLNAIPENIIKQALADFRPAFGRQEEVTVKNKKISIYLSKNPTGFNESVRTVKKLGAKHMLFVLNDQIADGKDISWIWDTDLEGLLDGKENIIVSGDRVYDMALRFVYSVHNSKFKIQNNKENILIYEDLKQAVMKGLEITKDYETLYIIPTYTAMLEIRKILTGKKIL